MSLTVTAAMAHLSAHVTTPAVRVSVSSSPAVTDSLVLWRVHQNGARYRVLTEDHPTVITTWTGLDYHAPFNEPVTYVAEAAGLSGTSAGIYVRSDSTTWLISASDPDLTVRVEKLIGPAAAYKYPTRAVSYQVLGRKLPVHRSDYPRGGEQGQIVVKLGTPVQRAALKALLAADEPTLINTPFGPDDIGWKWVQVGDFELSNPGGFISYSARYATLPYTETTQPDRDVPPVWTSDEVAALGLTSDQLAARYATSDDLKLDVPV